MWRLVLCQPVIKDIAFSYEHVHDHDHSGCCQSKILSAFPSIYSVKYNVQMLILPLNHGCPAAVYVFDELNPSEVAAFILLFTYLRWPTRHPNVDKNVRD